MKKPGLVTLINRELEKRVWQVCRDLWPWVVWRAYDPSTYPDTRKMLHHMFEAYPNTQHFSAWVRYQYAGFRLPPFVREELTAVEHMLSAIWTPLIQVAASLAATGGMYIHESCVKSYVLCHEFHEGVGYFTFEGGKNEDAPTVLGHAIFLEAINDFMRWDYYVNINQYVTLEKRPLMKRVGFDANILFCVKSEEKR